MRVAIAGSRTLEGVAARALLRFLVTLLEVPGKPGEAIVLLRRGSHTEPGTFERETAELCELLGIVVEWRQPVPGETIFGRGTVFRRDLDMVADADLVLTFVDEAADEDSGTTHLLENAIELDRPVYAYRVRPEGIVRWGEHDPEERFADIVPQPNVMAL